MRPLSHVLTDLIAASSDIVARRVTTRASVTAAVFAGLAAEVKHADGVPAENVRTTRAAMVMVIALEGYVAGGCEAGSPWLMLAGATLPLLRGDAWRQINNEKEAREAGRDR